MKTTLWITAVTAGLLSAAAASAGDYIDYHAQLQHNSFDRSQIHSQAHQYPRSWSQERSLHRDLNHQAYDDSRSHQAYDRYGAGAYGGYGNSNPGFGNSNFGYGSSNSGTYSYGYASPQIYQPQYLPPVSHHSSHHGGW